MKDGEKQNYHFKMKEPTDQLRVIGSIIDEEVKLLHFYEVYNSAVEQLSLLWKKDEQFVQQAFKNEEQNQVHTDNTTVSSGVSAMLSQIYGDVQGGSKSAGANNPSSCRCYKCGKG